MVWNFTVIKRVGIGTVTILLVALLGAQITARAAQTSPVVLKLEAGYEGYFRDDRWVPLLISVSNNGPDIVGELRVTASGTPGLSASAYQTSVELPTKSSKQIFLYVTLQYNTQQVKVELANDSGIIADDTRPVRPLRPADQLYAVITESPRGTIDLKNVRAGIGEAFQVNWRLDNIPRSTDGLRALDMLVLTDVDTGNLSTEQRHAIEEWVLGGGHLVVTGGPNWQKTQAGVTDLLPLKPASTTTLTSLPSIASYAGRPGDTLNAPADSPIIVAQGQATPDARVLVDESGTPLLLRRPMGEGFVDYLAADPGNEPFPSWKGRSSFWFTLLTTTGVQPSWSNGIADSGQAAAAANLIKGLRLPDVFQLGLFLGLYIIIIGPLNYLVLRQLGRRELAWITIPAIILACSAFTYMTGFSLRGTQATVNRMALVQVWPGSEHAQVDGVVGVLAPRRAVYTLDINDNMTLHVLDVSNYSGVNSANYTIQEDLTYAARDFPVDAGLTAAFAVSGYTQASPVDGSANLLLPRRSSVNGANSSPLKVTGKVKNTTNMVLNNAVVLASGGSSDLGTLQPGDERPFDFWASPNPQSPALALGSSLKMSSLYSSGSAYYYSAQDKTVQDIMGKNFSQYGRYNLGYGDTPEQQELRRRQAFLQAMVSTFDASGGRGSNVYLVGWADSSPIGVDLKGAGYVTEDTTLYVYSLPVTVTASNDIIALDSPALTWTPTDESTRRDASPYNLSLQAGDKVVFRYNPLPTIRLSEVTEIDLRLRASNINQGIISLWDWTVGKWIDINANRQSIIITNNVQRYIGPENSVEVQIEVAPGMPLASYDRIDLTLYGRLADTKG